MRLPSLLAALAFVLPAAAQGQRFDLDIRPAATVRPGAQLLLRYTIVNRSATGDSLLSFMVEAPAAPRTVSFGAGIAKRDTMTLDRMGKSPLGWWSFLELLPPGDTVAGLTLQTTGILGPVRWYAQDNFTDTVVVDTPDDTAMGGGPTPDAHTDTGWTVGAVAAPRPLTRASLLAAMQQQLVDMCARPWIREKTACGNLGRAIRAGDIQEVQRLVAEGRGRWLDERAYLILQGNTRLAGTLAP